jgi:hypothetical protein
VQKNAFVPIKKDYFEHSVFFLRYFGFFISVGHFSHHKNEVHSQNCEHKFTYLTGKRLAVLMGCKRPQKALLHDSV